MVVSPAPVDDPPANWIDLSVYRDPALGPEVPEKPETALLKPLRFRWLMEAHTPDERLMAFRRLVALADRTLHVAELSDALLRWDDARQRRWVFAYWNADPVSPAPAKETAA